MKRITMGIVACGLLLAACGKDEQTNSKAASPQTFAEDVMTAEMKSSVPHFVMARVNNETGVVETVTTNEAMAVIDVSTEAGKQALGAAEAKAFAQGKAVNVLEGDDSVSEFSSESFYGRVRVGNPYSWKPYYNYGAGYGFRYGFYGAATYNNYNYYRYGVNSYCGNGYVYPFYYGYPAYNYYGYY